MNASCSFGTIYLKGAFHSKLEEYSINTAGKVQDFEGDTSTEKEKRDVPISLLSPSDISIRCVDTTSVPGELHVFIEFDLPPNATILKQSSAIQITELVMRILDDLEDLQQDGHANNGINIVKSNIHDFMKVDDHESSLSDDVSSSSSSSSSSSLSELTLTSEKTGVIVYTPSNLLPESRFIRARQAEAALRFKLNSQPTIETQLQTETEMMKKKSKIDPGSIASNGHKFAMGDICTAFISRAGVDKSLRPGDTLGIRLDFRDSVSDSDASACVAVKVVIASKLIKYQGQNGSTATFANASTNSIKGSDLGAGVTVLKQDIVSSGVRNSTDALELNIRLALPASEQPSAGFKGMSLSTNNSNDNENGSNMTYKRYWLDFYFYFANNTSGNGNGNATDGAPSSSWSVPLDVQILPEVGDTIGLGLGVFANSKTNQLYVNQDI